MGIINWVQNRVSGKAKHRRFDRGSAVNSSRLVQDSFRAVDEAEKHLSAEQWPQAGLLSVGTLGNDELPVPGDRQELPEFTVEEVKKLQDALARLLRRAKSKSGARGEDSPPLDRFLNCPSSLEVDRRVVQAAKHGEGDGDLSPDTRIILTKARDLLTSTGRIRHRSFKFLLKKMFVCHGGFAGPAPSLKDPMESRMGKFLRTMLRKKINAGSSNGTATSRKYLLEDGPKEKKRGDRRRGCEEGEGEESYMRDRTDSEFIVLEI